MQYDGEAFARYVEKYGSRFAAVNAIAKEARMLAERCNNVITHSEAITWVCTGRPPKDLAIIMKIKAKQLHTPESFIDEMLVQVTDEKVRSCVRESVRRSKIAKHLVYYYADVEEPNHCSRIRILTNMIWYGLQDLKSEGKLK